MKVHFILHVQKCNCLFNGRANGHVSSNDPIKCDPLVPSDQQNRDAYTIHREHVNNTFLHTCP